LRINKIKIKTCTRQWCRANVADAARVEMNPYIYMLFARVTHRVVRFAVDREKGN